MVWIVYKLIGMASFMLGTAMLIFTLLCFGRPKQIAFTIAGFAAPLLILIGLKLMGYL